MSAVTADGDEGHDDDLAGSLAALSVADKAAPRLWTVDWNVTVRLEHEDNSKTENTNAQEVGLVFFLH